MKIAVSVRWNGTDITGIPTLIYHDELYTGNGPITDPDGPGRLICNSSLSLPLFFWRSADGFGIGSLTPNFDQIKQIVVLTNMSRLSVTAPFVAPNFNERFNGLWECYSGGFHVHVGIYARAGSEL